MTVRRPNHDRVASYRRKHTGGQSTAELAIVLPVLLILLLVIVQVGVVARDYVAVHHAVREAARQAALDPSGDVAVSAAVAASTSLDGDRLDADLSGGRARGELLTVELHYRAATVVPVVGILIGDVPLTGVAVVRVE